ncbi:transposase [Ferroplasma sp.]|uniref:transposase n=1 Tax=Ferroplasma sp. TaxID=2591003 RepID=UPI00307FCC43
MKDFALFLKDVPDAYPKARKLDLVMDNMNGHFPKSITETFGENEEKKMISRPEFHYTPKHGSWLNIAEIEINVMDMECTKRLFESYNELETSVNAWQKRMNKKKAKIKWSFTKEKADTKLSKYIQHN